MTLKGGVQRLLSGTALASDETGMRVGKANWWLWVFHHGDSAAFVADAHRSKAVVETFLGEWRPDVWLSDRLGSRTGWARRDHQFCLAHLIRDDAVFAPALKGLLKRACAIGADLRSVIETGRRRSIRALDAIRLTIQGAQLPQAA